MIGYLIRRIIQALIVLFIVTVFTLALVHLFPGGPIRALLGPKASPEQVAYYNRLYGFDQPFFVQYGKWVDQLFHGNLGYSIRLNQTVASEIALYLPKTVILVGLGLLVSLIFGIPLGIYQAVKRYTVGDYALTGLSFLGYATPTFFVGLLLVEWFAIDVHLFPP
ncbi:MAG TPA: ABC transporter permease, partial [Streptosporangiaceae bacterium]|nr:ABC transporter permease [Streptosporangiaceae bacterium]